MNTIRFLLLFTKKKPTYCQDQLLSFVNTDFLNDPDFVKSYALAKELMLDSWHGYDFKWRAYILCWASYQASKLEGDFVDCGANTGMFARMIIDFVNFEQLSKNYYLLDTYKGADKNYTTSEEWQRLSKMGYHDVYDQVCRTFKKFPQVKIIRGSVPNTLPQVKSHKIAFISIDMNCVQPEIEALRYFWDKLVPGGIVVFDDYGFAGHEQQKKAHDSFAKEKGGSILPLPTGQGLIIKW